MVCATGINAAGAESLQFRHAVKFYCHSGDYGDVIVALAAIRHLGPGVLVLKPEKFTRVPMTWTHAQPLIPLLLKQPYICGVEPWTDQPIDVDLNEFRTTCFGALRKDASKYKTVSLAAWYSQTFGVPMSAWETPWLTVPTAETIAPVIISKSLRYGNSRFPWPKVFDKYRDKFRQIGSAEEAFQTPGLFHRTNDFLEAAQVVAGARLVIANQSPIYHIAEGLKKPSVLEVWNCWPNCIYQPRPNAWYGFDENVHLPNLEELP